MKRVDSQVLFKKLIKEPKFKAEYEALAPEFELLEKMLKARTSAGLSQAVGAALFSCRLVFFCADDAVECARRGVHHQSDGERHAVSEHPAHAGDRRSRTRRPESADVRRQCDRGEGMRIFLRDQEGGQTLSFFFLEYLFITGWHSCTARRAWLN